MKGQILYSQTYCENQMCSFSTKFITDIEVSNIGDAVEAAKEISISRKDEMIDLIIDGKDYASYKNGNEYKRLPELEQLIVKHHAEEYAKYVELLMP